MTAAATGIPAPGRAQAPFENATRARWGRRRAIRKERRRDSVRAHVEEVRRGGWPAAAPNPKGWSGNGHRAASLVVDSRDKAGLSSFLARWPFPDQRARVAFSNGA